MQWASYCDLESFPDTSKVIQVFQIKIQTKKLKIILQNFMQMRKPNLVLIQISSTGITLSPRGDVIMQHMT